jgi:hypothetical protein
MSKIALDLKVGKIPVTFTRDAEGQLFGEMQQVDPAFGKIHERATVANLLGVKLRHSRYARSDGWIAGSRH